MRFRSLWQGIVLVLIGLVLLLKALGIIRISILSLWPLILMGLGLSFESEGWSDPAGKSGSLFAGGVLLTYGFMFLACQLMGWELMQYVWPGFIFGPAVGFYQRYKATGSLSNLAEARLLFTIATLLMLGIIVPMRYLVPAIMIGAGVKVILSILKSSR